MPDVVVSAGSGMRATQGSRQQRQPSSDLPSMGTPHPRHSCAHLFARPTHLTQALIGGVETVAQQQAFLRDAIARV